LPEKSEEIFLMPALRTIRLTGLMFALLGILCFPAPLAADQLPQEALATFPSDTLQVAFTNLAELRSLPTYPQLRERFLNQQMRPFQDFLRPIGIDPDKDVDEVMVGWRGELAGPTGYLGLAAGRFRPDLVEKYFDRTNLPTREYAGANLYAFGSGSDPGDIFFTFLNSSILAFGRLPDLKAMLDARQGSANALNANSDFVGWEGELESTAPQWGILNGKSVANLAGLWLAGGKQNVDLSSLSRSVRALLYRVQWDTEFSGQLILVCDSPDSAAGFAGLLNALQKPPQQPAAPGGTALPSILQNIDAHRDGARLELEVSGPPEALGQVLGGN
jgi:hypothetical protein